MMVQNTPQMCAGLRLRVLIQENYTSQEEFAEDYGTDIRTVSRYINQGINKIDVIQELSEFFNVEFSSFFINNTEKGITNGQSQN